MDLDVYSKVTILLFNLKTHDSVIFRATLQRFFPVC